MKEGGGGGRCGGSKRLHKNNFRKTWKTHTNLKGGEVLVGRWVCSRTTTGR